MGNPAFGLLYDATVPATFRVVVDGDFVPGIAFFCSLLLCFYT